MYTNLQNIKKINTDEMLKKLLDEGILLSKKHKELTLKLKKLTKLHFKVCKDLQNKNKNKKTKKAASGFAKPTVISNNLCDFLGIKHGLKVR